MKTKKGPQDEFDYFDDCPICQAMKQASQQGRDLTEAELKEVFAKAQEQGAIAGGPLLSDQPKKNS